MIFRRYLLRELMSTWLLWIMALTLVLLSIVAARTFKQIDVNALDLTVWLRLFSINGLRYFPHLLAIATYLAAFNTSTRYWQDGEIWIWRNAGVSPSVLLRQLALFILPMTLVLALLSGWLVPWSYRQSAMEQVTLARTPFTRFSETGQFLSFPSGLTVRIEGASGQEKNTKQAANTVFVFRESGEGKELAHSSIWAKSAQIYPGDERVVLTLNEGVLKQYRAHDTAPKLDMHFKALRYFFALPDAHLDDKPKWMSWSRLWSARPTQSSQFLALDGAIQAERFWRWSFPLHVLIITWIAWSLGRHNTRAGQSTHLVSLILVDQIYLNLINLVENSLTKGQMAITGLAVGCLLHAAFIYAGWRLWVRQSR